MFQAVRSKYQSCRKSVFDFYKFTCINIIAWLLYLCTPLSCHAMLLDTNILWIYCCCQCATIQQHHNNIKYHNSANYNDNNSNTTITKYSNTTNILRLIIITLNSHIAIWVISFINHELVARLV